MVWLVMKKESLQHCPSREDLSAFYDGFLRDSRIADHLRDCPSCREAVAAMEQLDRMMADCTAAPPELSGRVIAACHRDAERQDADRAMAAIMPTGGFRGFPGRMMRHAAVLLATAAVASFATYSLLSHPAGADGAVIAAADHDGLLQSMPAAAAHSPSAPSGPLPLAASVTDSAITREDGGGYSLADSLRERQAAARTLAARESAIRHEALDTVSVSSDGGHARSASADRKLVLLPDVVTHVWQTSQAIDARRLQELSGLDFEELGAADDLGIRTFSCTGSDAGIQRAINELHGRSGWSLLSPALPQPGGEDRIFFRNRPLKYIITLVPGK